jgi:hypothetical protein
MSEYNRFTRECTLGQLRPELRQAIRAFFKEHELDEQSAGILACYETTSEKKSTGKLVAWLNDQSDTTVHLGMLLTPDWLIWARSGDRSGTRLNAANLKEIRVKVYSSRLTQDAGLEVSGYISSSKGRVKGYIGMESEAVAQKFCDQVKQAIDKVNPPSARKMPRWLGGP